MTLLDQYSLATDRTFIVRVQQAMVAAAIAVANEESSNDYTTDVQRGQYARSVLDQPTRYAEKFAFGVASNVAITASSIDSDIEFTVNSIFSAYAGIRANTATPPAAPAAPMMSSAPAPAPVETRQAGWIKRFFMWLW